ncbi:MAG: tetratricopeptide repeat protein [Planctomycetaceae bacterium]
MRRFGLAALVLFCSFYATRLWAFDHGPGTRNYGGRWGGWNLGLNRGWSGFHSFGYSSVGAGSITGLNYYYGPVWGGGWPYTGAYYSPWGYVPAPVFGYTPPPAPIIVLDAPIWPGLDPANNAVLQEWLPGPKDGAARGAPPDDDLPLPVKTSNVDAKRKSMRYQATGDEYLAKGDYTQALMRYRQAYAAAPDRSEPRFRVAVTLAALGHFGQAADELKRLVRLDPRWPAHGDRLDDVFGPEHQLAKHSMLSRAADWVKEDIRDPQRLFLMGVFLHFNEDVDKARPFFEAAGQLSNRPKYVQAFLEPSANREQAPRRNAPGPNRREEAEPEEEPVPRPLAELEDRASNSGPGGPKLVFPGDPQPRDANER